MPCFFCREILSKRVINKFSNLSAWVLLSLITGSSLWLSLARFFPGHKPDALDSLLYQILPILQILVFGAMTSMINAVSKRAWLWPLRAIIAELDRPLSW